jgi:hypothetical protein
MSDLRQMGSTMASLVRKLDPCLATGILFLIIALVLMTTHALGQPAAQRDAIRQACPADFQRHCAGVAPGGPDALACLQQKSAQLSSACRQAVAGAAGVAPAPTTAAASSAAPMAGAAPTAGALRRPGGMPRSAATGPIALPAEPLPLRVQIPILRGPCAADHGRLCRGVQPGGGRVISCLASNGTVLSPACRHALAALNPR